MGFEQKETKTTKGKSRAYRGGWTRLPIWEPGFLGLKPEAAGTDGSFP
jgi:hypothetical protein